MKEEQLSLLDLQRKNGVVVKHDFVWRKFFYDLAGQNLEAFKRSYSEEPIFWKRFNPSRIDVFMTDPQNAFVIDLNSGKLMENKDYLSKIYATPPDKFSMERRRHLSKQIVMLLDGHLTMESWISEIMELIKFKQEGLEDMVSYLKDHSIEYCLEKGAFKNELRIFADPRKILEIYNQGLELGFFK
jgi:hypothetical protein